MGMQKRKIPRVVTHFQWLHLKHAAPVNYLCHLTTILFKLWQYTHHKHKQDKETYPHYDGKWKQQMYVDVKRQFIVNYNKTVGLVLVMRFQNEARVFTHKHRRDEDTLWILRWHGFWIYKQNTKLRIDFATIYQKLCNKKSSIHTHTQLLIPHRLLIILFHFSWDFPVFHLCAAFST